MRLIIAFVLSALAPTLVVAVPYLIDQFLRYELDEYIAIRTGKVFIVVFVYSALHAAMLGLPGYMILKALGRLNRLSVYVGSFIVGAIPMSVMFTVEAWGRNKADEVVLMLLIFGGMGLIGGIVFWGAKPNKKQQGDLRRLC
ncbi:hypothetical protein [Alcanivorax sediminis]|uniref:Uncharacterized protein n=1 Tax=Alcanivorax sediminis TaxID=2663008 RepID=A0A6N7LZQ2_9GAMM|nr:hypothetical protein [Alcanivorax sediminis]MQX54674.1 hypothetical protein [Alcanivorax sediminis]